ncbi:MAG TPA: FGGY family carbohydrate kinase [Saprospiraceae bacterium]|nr:FGGY family carbohydrate kinase [Saprospiraceae bacterium]HNT19808.1 FGGY family carbohydrate kinase [Saprospiraceae bacterium]
MYILGIDLGSSFIKASLIELSSQRALATASVPDQEMPMRSLHPGWAEQEPEVWWDHIKALVRKILVQTGIPGRDISAIGISYQMHGLVLIDHKGQVLRPSIIWCDSRSVPIGDAAFKDLGTSYCLGHLLNSPGNFTASKLRWVIENEPSLAEQVHAFLLPGDFINFKLTGEINTTVPALSEGMFWDFAQDSLALPLFRHYRIPESWCPSLVPTFAIQGRLSSQAASETGLHPGTPVCYRAGDQPNNAFSLNVLRPGEIAATAGTSGVVYGVQQKLATDEQSRINAFAHVNHTATDPRIGILLCVNGTGIANSWLKKNLGGTMTYDKLNQQAAQVPAGSDHLLFYPFGNGAERMLGNRMVQSHLMNLDFNRHGIGHLARAIQEGIVYALRYGVDIMTANGMTPRAIKAGKANLFLSPVFRQMFSSLLQVPLEFYDTDGATGAARGAGIGLGVYTPSTAFETLHRIEELSPDPALGSVLNELYHTWKNQLEKTLLSTL